MEEELELIQSTEIPENLNEEEMEVQEVNE